MQITKMFKFSMSYFLHFFVCFFLFSGFYAGLGLVINFLGNEFTRFYSIPIRFICSLIMILFVIKGAKIVFKDIWYFVVVLLFLLHLIFCYQLDLYGQLGFFKLKYEYIMYTLIYCVFPFLYFSFCNYEKIYSILEKSIISSGFVLNIVSIVLYKDLIINGIARISFLQYESDQGFLSPLSLSYASSLTMAICFCRLMLNKFSYKSVILLIVLITSFVPFSLGASRGSILTLFFSLFVYFVFFTKTKHKIKILAFLPLILFLLTYASNKIGSTVFERFFGISDSYQSKDTSVTNRLEQWQQAISYIKESPVLGGHFLINDVYPHNIFLEIFMGQGFILFSIFIFLIAFTFSKVVLFCRNNDYVLMVMLLHGIIMSIFSGSVNTAILLFSSFGLFVSLTRYSKG